MADIDELKKKLEDGWVKGEPYVFVSYASKDKEKVYDFVYELRKRGINEIIATQSTSYKRSLIFCNQFLEIFS